ncbi:hypothetical protein [Microbacterium flavum]|uniref:Uncharacterized protein n=1 Tax=Microbacterium flavum TaxID=415216 RepID=A0ABS5XV88_9MICO|nr:hypothetical protein [Microbacterium flavum]MBT8798331.1 hypothetical protein [Microbacterium flavum]
MSEASGGRSPALIDTRSGRFETGAALVAAVLVGVDVPLPYNTPLSIVVGLALLPVVLNGGRRYRSFVALCILVFSTVGTGLLIAEFSSAPSSTSLAIAQCMRVLSLAFAFAVLLWARGRTGARRIILAFATGMLVSVPIGGIHLLNPWKFDLGLPLTLIALSLPFVYRRPIPQAVVGLLLIAVNAAFSSRSAAGFLLIAVAVSFTITPAADGVRRGRAWVVFRYAQVAAVAAGAYFLLQAAILDGMLGDDLQERTQAQVAASGSVLTGGRPEMGASVALITSNPWGYGAGAIPTPTQILVAKSGMARLGYDPNNGYVERYMFGTSFEVHSTLGDLWITFGIVGAVLAIFCVIVLLRGTGHAMATGTLSTVAVYLVIRGVWDMAFSPVYTSVLLLPLALAVVAIPRRTLVDDVGVR